MPDSQYALLGNTPETNRESSYLILVLARGRARQGARQGTARLFPFPRQGTARMFPAAGRGRDSPPVSVHPPLRTSPVVHPVVRHSLRARQAVVLLVRYRLQVNMISHQAKPKQIHTESLSVGADLQQVHFVIRLVKENISPIQISLRQLTGRLQQAPLWPSLAH